MKKYADVITGALGLIIGAAILVMSIQIGLKENNAIGADFMPKIASVIMLLMSGKLLYDGIKASRSYKEEILDYAKNYRGVAVMIIACILYAELLKPVGFIITSMVFLFLALVMMSKKEETNYIRFGIITVVSVLAIYFVFTRLFGIRLPHGIL